MLGENKVQKIKKLSHNLANKIAAGEVVEAPVSVVKELIDNSIDAGATRIQIEIRGGGKKFIEVSDNGVGIPAEDIELAFERFSTSKITIEEELWNIKTLGFRGEFLSSVGSVAKVTLSSKTKNETTGTEVVIEGGKIESNKQIGRGEGTTVTVRELFFNTPARRKFLKSDRAEFAYIHEMVRKYVLSHQNIAFKLVNDEKEIFNLGSSDQFGRILRILGKNIARNLLPIKAANDSWKLTGYISKPIESQKTRRYQFFYVNKRNIKSKLLNMAIEEGYREKIQKGNFPIVILFLESIKSQKVDVNVHPKKLEVRFAKEEEVLSLVSNVIKSILIDRKETELVSKKNFFKPLLNAKKSSKNMSMISSDSQKRILDQNISYNSKKGSENTINQSFSFEQTLDRKILSESKIIGQLFNEYILAESDDLLLLIDTKSAAERIEYELINSSKKGKKQILLTTKEIIMSPVQREILTVNKYLIEKMGYNINIDDDRVYLEAVPVIYGQIASIEVLTKIIEMLKNKMTPVNELEKELAYSIAKKRSIGILTKKQMHEMVQLLCRSKIPFTAPNGRPTVICLSNKEFKRKFSK